MRIISRVGIGKNPTSNHLDVTGSANFDSQLFIQNNVFLNANVDLGNASSDLIAFNGQASTSVIPNTNEVLNFGSTSLFWQNTYTKNLIIKNTGSIESDGLTLNIGVGGTNTSVNIGNSNTIINIFASTDKIQQSDLTINDKRFTLNKNGTVGSGFNCGFEIEENSIKTSYLKTTLGRNKWEFKAPNKTGTISFQPSISNINIISSASIQRTWTVLDESNTFTGTNLSQTISNKTLNTTQVTGDFTITGRAIGVGFLPIGSIIAIMPHISGTYNCTATTAADSYGFVRCGFSGQSGNQVIADASSPLNGQTIPRINNDVFLMGNVTSGVAGGSNSKTLTTAIIPAHNHSIDHNHPNKLSSSDSMDIQHTHGVGIGDTDTNHQHNYYEEGLDQVDNSWRGGGSASGPYMSEYRARDRTTNWVGGEMLLGPPPQPGWNLLFSGDIFGNGNWIYYYRYNFGHGHSAWTGGISVNNSGHSHSSAITISSINSGNGPGSSTSFDIKPVYIPTVYVMRVK